MSQSKRREFIKLSALAFAGVVLEINDLTALAQKTNGYHGKWDSNTPVNWDAFLESLTELVQKQKDKVWKEKRYAKKVK